METLLPQLLIDLPEGTLTPQSCFQSSIYPDTSQPSDRQARSEGERSGGSSPPKEYWLEIGFGSGEHLAHIASLYPNTGIIGCEPYLNGVAGLLKHIDDHRLNNVRIYADDARLLIDTLPDACITRAYILYPDPWPKARHKKRRLVNTALLDRLARIMPKGATLRLATDDDDYCTWMLEHLLPHPAFEWNATTSADWLTAPKDWTTTRYEQKKAFDRGLTPSYLNFTRI